jgi:putative toxin-antitoxin system antitoxin component (TIGR02293 family)
LLRVSRLLDRAVALFENDEVAARRWLTRPNRGLGGRTPLEFSRTEVGAREVEVLIGRLEYGLVA